MINVWPPTHFPCSCKPVTLRGPHRIKGMHPTPLPLPLPRTPPLGAILAALLMSVAAPAPLAAPVPLLTAAAFKHHIEKFNAEDAQLYANAYPNAKAWDFLAANIPLFDCPDKGLSTIFARAFFHSPVSLTRTGSNALSIVGV